MPTSRLTTRTSAILAFVGLSAAAAVLTTIAVTPAIAVSGVSASSTISMFDSLPDYLQIGPLAEKTNIYAKDGKKNVLLASFYDENRVEVAWDKVAQTAKDAAVAAEDPRFYEHGGIDIAGTARAAVMNVLKPDQVQGGSSITQQYVKNILVQQASAITDPDKQAAAYKKATDTTMARKLVEMRLAVGVEKEYTKDQILLGYLNIALFGGQVYGIEAAANYYYDTTAEKLTLPQAASLLAIVNNPDNLRIDQPDNKVNGKADGYSLNKERRDYILDNMLEEGMITKAEHKAAIATKITPKITPVETGCQAAGGAAYYCDYVTNVLQNDPTFGDTEAERWSTVKRGGLDIYTTLDVSLQKTAEDAVHEYVPEVTEGANLGGVAVGVEPGTGRVLFMAQNTKYSQDPDVLKKGPQYSAINYNTDRAYGGSSGFQPGSTYKTFTLAEWLKEGHSLYETVNGYRTSDWGDFTDSCLGTQNAGGWDPGNDEGGGGGVYSAMTSTTQSINTGYVAMAKELDLCGIHNMAEAFGVHRADGTTLGQNPASVLGTEEIAPLTMAAAFAGMAASGEVCDPIVIDKITGPGGKNVEVPSANCAQKVDKKIVEGMQYAMQRVMYGTAGPSENALTSSVPHIGKTGTTDDAVATWMSGASTSLATVAGVFNVSGSTNLRETYFDTGQAASARHQIWPAIMNVADKELGGKAFTDPESSMIYGSYSYNPAPQQPSTPSPTATPEPTTPAEPEPTKAPEPEPTKAPEPEPTKAPEPQPTQEPEPTTPATPAPNG